MSTETSLTILVVILSLALAVFLILGIVLLIKLLKVVTNVQHITEKAELIADRAEDTVEMFRNAAAPVAFGRVLSSIVDAVSKRKDK